MHLYTRNLPKSEYFSIILKLSKAHNPELLCGIANLSISGYYKHKRLILSQSTKKEREQEDLKKIQKYCIQRKRGYRMVSMKLRQEGIIMNHKKVLRLMKKYDILAQVRRKNPYRNILKANQEHRTKKNILKRRFCENGDTPLKKFGTDISYLWKRKGWSYLSIIRDMITGEIVSHVLSNNLWLSATLKSVKLLEQELWVNKHKGILIHSDQWWHYTHPSYQKQLKDLWIIQSMSRKGNCLDNAPTESFFGHMKDEIDIQWIESFRELEKYIENYIFEYNNHRPQWNRKKMTPIQYRNHLLKNKN